MKQKLKIIAITTLLTVAAAQAGITTTVTGTANSSTMGYTSGESYTFTWVVNDSYTGGDLDFFLPNAVYIWSPNSLEDPELWDDVSGDGLGGTYARPSVTPADTIVANSQGLSFAAQSSSSSISLGLTVNSIGVHEVSSSNLVIPGLDYSAAGPIDLGTYLASYAGSYDQTSGQLSVRDTADNVIEFSPTNLTIIPEPATCGVIVLFAGGLLAIRRIFII